MIIQTIFYIRKTFMGKWNLQMGKWWWRGVDLVGLLSIVEIVDFWNIDSPSDTPILQLYW